MSVEGRESRVERVDRLESESNVTTADSDLSTIDSRLATLDFERVIVEHIRPAVDGGRFPIKRTVGERVEVHADIFADGHDVIVAMLRDRRVDGVAQGFSRADDVARGFSRAEPAAWRETPMTLVAPGTDEWTADFEVDAIGWHEYSIVAWVDRFFSWRHALQLKAAAGQDLNVELLEGSMLIREAAARAEQVGAGQADSNWLLTQADTLSEATRDITVALSDELAAAMTTYADRSRATASAPLRVWVDRARARFGAWYEFFPRSTGRDPSKSGTFRDAATRLCGIADLGFDVVYL